MFLNKGFTLIEMVFTLSIILSMTFLTLPVIHTQSSSHNIEDIQYNIASIINSAKCYSLISHQKVELLFTTQSVSYHKNSEVVAYNLPNHCSFTHLEKIYFNKNGNINQANHIILKMNDKNIKLIFHLGNGDFYFENERLHSD
ncbi:MAG: competence type IV pilus minor pilin ComGD [Faecalibacillus sp.]